MPNLDSIFRNNAVLFISLLLFRIFNSSIIRTTYVADEYWQSIEVAHKWVFGYGSLTWEWNPNVALRSPIHPLLIGFTYHLLRTFNLHKQWIVLFAPRLLHAFLAALTDLSLYFAALRLAGDEVAKWALFHHLCNWFTFYCLPRTLSNCLECTLTTLGFACYPWSTVCNIHLSGHANTRSAQHPMWFILIAVSCVLLRPTALIIWAPLCLLHICQVIGPVLWKNSKCGGIVYRNPSLIATIKLYLGLIILCVFISCLFDRWIFGHWTINQWNFIRFNLFLRGSEAYGIQPWHWYLSQGFPALLFTQIPCFLYAIWIAFFSQKYDQLSIVQRSNQEPKLKRHQKQNLLERSTLIYVWTIGWTLFCYSFLAHKEFRFIFPALPLASYLCGLATVHWLRTDPNCQRILNSYKEKSLGLMVFIVSTHVPLALYTCLLHQGGGLAALNSLNQRIELHQTLHNTSINVLCLMPCHTIPSIGYMHRNISMVQLSCDPDLSYWSNKVTTQVDEANLFYTHPVTWLNAYQQKGPDYLPHFILAFDHLINTFSPVREVLENWRFGQCGSFFHAHFLTHSRHGKYVLIFCNQNYTF